MSSVTRFTDSIVNEYGWKRYGVISFGPKCILYYYRKNEHTQNITIGEYYDGTFTMDLGEYKFLSKSGDPNLKNSIENLLKEYQNNS